MPRRYQASIMSGSYVPFLTPNAPTSVVATAGNAAASVAFTAPANVGGGAITSYTVISSGGQTASGASSPITVSGLTNGTSYTFTVYASNTYGNGPQSTASSAVTPAASTTMEVLIVAGGGGGAYKANARAGAGGAGGLLYYGSETPKTPNGAALAITPGTTYTVTVGAGGVRSEPGVGDSQGTGSNSVFSIYTASGGGGGGYNDSPAVGWPGGSGGGGFIGAAGGAGVSGQGNNGGAGTSGGAYPSGGGGGAGAVGEAGIGGTRGGNGGNGLQYSISGTATYYAGGGSGDVYFAFSAPNPGTPGLGGGGTGYNNINVAQWGTSGAANTGGGGGSGSDASNGLGGSGIVIIKSAIPAVSTTGSPSVTTSGGFYIYRYTSSGSITF